MHTRVLVLPMYSVHPYFSLKNLGKKVCILHGKIQYFSLGSSSPWVSSTQGLCLKAPVSLTVELWSSEQQAISTGRGGEQMETKIINAYKEEENNS